LTLLRLRYVHAFKDRHGTTRHYFRREGCKPDVALPGLPGSVEFMRAYQQALAASEARLGSKAPTEIGASRTKAGTVSAAVSCYFSSHAYQELADGTRKARRRALERFRERHGERDFAKLERRWVELMLAEMDAPHARRNFIKALRGLIATCLPVGLIDHDPTTGIRVRVPSTSGFKTWSEADIEQFRGAHPIGTRARLAFGLLLFTGQRRADIVRMGRQHVRDGAIAVRQQKTGAALQIPLHPALLEIIEATPAENMTFLTTGKGEPFTAAGFTNWFRDMCADAGLPRGLSAHGLRKAACRRLAEAGCTEHEIAAISGHKSLSEVARYTREADQKRLAARAMQKVAGASLPEKKVRENKTRPSSGNPADPELATPAQVVESKDQEKGQNKKWRPRQGSNLRPAA
jgi:integrase